jgi:hypothetical protein
MVLIGIGDEQMMDMRLLQLIFYIRAGSPSGSDVVPAIDHCETSIMGVPQYAASAVLNIKYSD